MVGRNRQARPSEAEPGAEVPYRDNVRLIVRRVRLRQLVRIGFSFGWITSVIPAVLISIVLVLVLHGIWTTLDGWSPWTPWSADTRILGAALPNPPEFRPREVLRLNGLYRALAPLGQHPIIGGVALTLLLTIIGELGLTTGLVAAGVAYNRFASLTGGIEVEVSERPARRRGRSRGTPRAGRNSDDASDDWDEATLRW